MDCVGRMEWQVGRQGLAGERDGRKSEWMFGEGMEGRGRDARENRYKEIKKVQVMYDFCSLFLCPL